jgi:TolB protein
VHTITSGRAYGWSPDGSRLLLSRWPALYVVNADGSHEVRITSAADGYNAVWSPDGTRIAYEGPDKGRTLWVAQADGSGTHQLSAKPTHGGFYSGNLTWSPDGKEIVFAGFAKGSPRQWLYAVPADGSTAPRPLTIHAQIARPSQPAWSPDGSKIAFSITTLPDAGLYVMNADGTDVRRIADGHGAVWSPDSSMLAFRENGNHTVHVDGTHLVDLPRGSWAGLSWSPDSKFVAFAGGESHVSNGNVFVVEPDGRGLMRIIHRKNRGIGLLIIPLWRHGTATTETG